jgi:16S rRNA (guanine966-N2)-methyltransferase
MGHDLRRSLRCSGLCSGGRCFNGFLLEKRKHGDFLQSPDSMKPKALIPSASQTISVRAKNSASAASRTGGAGEVRIIGGKIGAVRLIGGQWKRSKLSVLSRPGLRPTPDRVRETLFNWLGQDLSGLRCVDVFAGSGALGFEAASRGAQDVLLIEQDPQLVTNLQSNKTRLKADNIRIQRGDGISILRNLPKASIDVIFLDPPFDSGLFLESIQAAAVIVSAQGAIYLEAPEAWTDEKLKPLGLQLLKNGKAGAVYFCLISRHDT